MNRQPITASPSALSPREHGPLRAGAAPAHDLPLSSAPAHLRQPRQPLWLHLHFPQLPLEVLTRGVTTAEACVLASGEGRRQLVWKANARAAILGIKPGMAVAAAHALGQLSVLERNPRAEQRALTQLCHWATQFSPVVSATGTDGLVLEIGGSLRLFQGLDGLLRQVRRGLKELGYRVQHAVAPVPLAATVLARAGTRAHVLDQHDLTRALAALPMTVLELDAAQKEAFASIGVHCLADCRRLPRAGLARRFSPAVVTMLDRLYGSVPDPRAALPLPRIFESLLELPWEVRAAPALLVAGERLLHELVGHLRAHAALTRRLQWRLLHVPAQGREPAQSSTFELGLTHAGRDIEHMLLLLRESLTRLRLSAPVCAIELRVTDLVHDGAPATADLFGGGSRASGEAYAAFVDRLRSRCGDGALQGLQERADRRPEQAWSWRQVEGATRLPRAAAAVAQTGSRPVWLLKPPQSLPTREGRPELGGPLRLMPERERIEGGWWGEEATARDYFVATTPAGSRVWIYRELAGARRWFLHGVFD